MVPGLAPCSGRRHQFNGRYIMWRIDSFFLSVADRFRETLLRGFRVLWIANGVEKMGFR